MTRVDDSTTRKELASEFEAMAAAAISERPKVLKARQPGRARLLKTDGGEVVTHGQVLQGLLRQAEILVAVQDGRRPAYVLCEKCRTPVRLGPIGPLKRVCKTCRPAACSKCGKPGAARPGPWACMSCSTRPPKLCGCGATLGDRRSDQCRSCAAKERVANISPEKRREAARKAGSGNALLPAEQRSQIARKRQAQLSTEKKAEISKRASRRMRDLMASLTQDQRAERMQKAIAAVTTESVARSWETRRRKTRANHVQVLHDPNQPTFAEATRAKEDM